MAAMAAAARYIYENEPVTLSEIAKQLEVNYSTVRNWKCRDKQRNAAWKENHKTRKRCMNKKSLDNLIYFKPMNQLSVTHGIYAKELTAEAQQIYEEIHPQPAASLETDLLYMAFAKYLAAQKHLDHSNPAHVKADNKMCRALFKIAKAALCRL